jgi:hypothetical protein
MFRRAEPTGIRGDPRGSGEMRADHGWPGVGPLDVDLGAVF